MCLRPDRYSSRVVLRARQGRTCPDCGGRGKQHVGVGVTNHNAFPARLEALLRAKGIEAHVNSAGVIGDTTAGMLRRIDYAAPDGIELVILQPGGNDLRFFGTREQREGNIAAIERRLRERGIKVIVFDPIFSPDFFSFRRNSFHVCRPCADRSRFSASGNSGFRAATFACTSQTTIIKTFANRA